MKYFAISIKNNEIDLFTEHDSLEDAQDALVEKFESMFGEMMEEEKLKLFTEFSLTITSLHDLDSVKVNPLTRRANYTFCTKIIDT